MRIFLKKILLFLLPALLAVGTFFLFEPYDYFGLKGNATYLSKPLSAMREVLYEQPTHIILGDSQMANLNLDYIEELTGTRYTMLGFGGSQVGECIELFWYAAERTELEQVIFGVGFYTSGGEQGPGRIPSLIPKAENPLQYLTGANYWLEAIGEAKRMAVNLLADLTGNPGWKSYPEDPTAFTSIEISQERGEYYRRNLEEYAALLCSVTGTDGSFRIEPETMDALGEVIDYCDQNGIELIFVFPPVHESVFDLVIGPIGIDDNLAAYKAYLRTRATVFDLCFRSSFTTNEDNFYDGFHLAPEQKKTFARLIFTGEASDAIVRSYPSFQQGGSDGT